MEATQIQKLDYGETMSVIWGIVHKNMEPVSKTVRQTIIEDLGVYKIDSVNTWEGDNIYLGCGIQYITPESLHEVLPNYNENRGLAITADAIIDNRKELFGLLDIPPDKHSYITDSELIVLAYERWGKDCPRYLVGDFSFVIWNKRKNELFCARDHTGKRTFYYYSDKDKFVFSTLMKPIIELMNENPELNERWITDFLALPLTLHEMECIETIYTGICQLPPACSMTVCDNEIHIDKYWNPQDEVKLLKLKSDREYEEAFNSIFFEAVRCCARSTGDVGVMLSGGLDSGSVACIAAKLLKDTDKRLKTFSSIPMEGYIDKLPKYKIGDESEYIKTIKDKYENIDLNFCRCEGKHSVTDVENLLKIYEQPYKTIENMFWFNEIVKTAAEKNCKVLLTGQFGNFTVSFGDFNTHMVTLFKKGKLLSLLREINEFSRFHRIPAHKLRKAVLRIITPYRLRKLVSSRTAKACNDFETVPANEDLLDKWKVKYRFGKKGYYVHPDRFYDLKEMKKQMLEPVIFSQLSSIETKFGLANGIVIRDPTRDKRVIEFCLSLPADQFVRNGQERFLIRRAMQDILPDKIRLNSNKRGLQSADWVQRLQADWENVYTCLEDITKVQNINKYISGKKIENSLLSLKESFDTKKKPVLRMMLICSIFSRFIKENNFHNNHHIIKC